MILIATVTLASLTALVVGKRLFFGSKSWLKFKPLGASELKRIPYFAKLDVDQLVRVEKLIREVRVPAGAYVMREHHVGDALYLVVSGRVNILKRGTHQQTLVQSVGPGEFIGEMSLLCDVKRIASAQTEAASVLIHVDGEDFAEFMNVSSEINDAVWAACDRHAIDLLMRDHESLRSLSLSERSVWLEAREAAFWAGGETVKAALDGYFGLVSGSAQIGGKDVEAPVLVPCAAGQDFKVTARGRVVFLGDPKRRVA